MMFSLSHQPFIPAKRRIRFLPIFLLLSAVISSGCARPAREWIFQGLTMGTTYTVRVPVRGDLNESGKAVLEESIRSQLDLVNERMSTYDPESELSRFNRFQGTGRFELSAETLEVFRLAQEVSRVSGGAFDVTVGPLVNAWGFGPDGSPAEEPDEATLAALRARVGYQHLVLEESAVRKTRPDLSCDLAAIAKGYAVDRVAKALEQRGVGDYMVEVGGEIRAKGSSVKGKPWRIGIERPDPSVRAVHRIVELDGLSMATSGDYRNYREKDGARVSHLIDPRSGRPIAHRLASVTVIHPRCAVADAFATALIVLGPEEGYPLAEAQNLAAVLIIRDDESGRFVEKTSPAFDALIETVSGSSKARRK